MIRPCSTWRADIVCLQGTNLELITRGIVKVSGVVLIYIGCIWVLKVLLKTFCSCRIEGLWKMSRKRWDIFQSLANLKMLVISLSGLS